MPVTEEWKEKIRVIYHTLRSWDKPFNTITVQDEMHTITTWTNLTAKLLLNELKGTDYEITSPEFPSTNFERTSTISFTYTKNEIIKILEAVIEHLKHTGGFIESVEIFGRTTSTFELIYTIFKAAYQFLVLEIPIDTLSENIILDPKFLLQEATTINSAIALNIAAEYLKEFNKPNPVIDSFAFLDRKFRWFSILFYTANALIQTYCNIEKPIPLRDFNVYELKPTHDITYTVNRDTILAIAKQIVEIGYRNIEPPKTIKVDEEEYDMLTVLHMLLSAAHQTRETGEVPFSLHGTQIFNTPQQTPTQQVPVTGNNNEKVIVQRQKIFDKIVVTYDNIDGPAKDKARVNQLCNLIRQHGIKCEVYFKHYRSGLNRPDAEYYYCKERPNEKAILAKIQLWCAGTLRGYVIDLIKRKCFQNKKFAQIGWTSKDYIKKVSWLPRAHDDNFSPSWFKGISYPYKYLINNGILVWDEGKDLNGIAKWLVNNCYKTVTIVQKTAPTTAASGRYNWDVPNELKPYLQPCPNAPVGISWAKQIVDYYVKQGYKYRQLVLALLKHIATRIKYSYYFNTRKGATQCYLSAYNNCCDTAHVVKTVLATAGFPVRYHRGVTSSGIGHVYNAVWLKDSGRWHVLDCTGSDPNFTFDKPKYGSRTTHTYRCLPY